MQLRFSYGNLSFGEVRTFLLETDDEFPAPLSARVDIEAYARKLSEFSDFSLCRDGESIVGMISCYMNRPPLGYITNACVKKQYQSRKVFSKLFHQLLSNARERGILRYQLEVDVSNGKARSIYEHYGFREVEFRPDTHKYLMQLNLD